MAQCKVGVLVRERAPHTVTMDLGKRAAQHTLLAKLGRRAKGAGRQTREKPRTTKIGTRQAHAHKESNLLRQPLRVGFHNPHVGLRSLPRPWKAA